MKRWLMAALGLPGQGATPLAGPLVWVMATLPAEYRTRPILRGMPVALTIRLLTMGLTWARPGKDRARWNRKSRA